MLKLRCSHCDARIPSNAGVFKKRKRLQAVLENKAPVFCDKSCAAKYAHANRSEEAKALRAVNNRATRGLEAKTCKTCGSEFFSKKKKFCSLPCWHSYTKTRSAEETKVIYEKRAVTNKAKSEEQKAEERQRHLSSLPVNRGGEALDKWRKSLKRDAYQRMEQSANTKAWWQSLSEKEKTQFFEKRSAKWFALPADEKQKVIDKLKAAHSKRTPSQIAAIANKVHQSKKANGSYNTSKDELYILGRLRSLLGPQVEHLFKNHPQYKWEADFYDPLAGSIFEYQGFPSHGGCAYDESNKEHQAKLRKLKKSSGWLPALTAKVWAKSDVQKRQSAASLPFVEWFTLKQFNDWFDERLKELLKADSVVDGCFYRNDELVLVPHDVAGDARVYYPWDDIRKVARLVNKGTKKYYARKLSVEEISVEVANKFCDMHHLQNSCRGTKLAIGIIDRAASKPKLLGVMTFGAPRYNKKCQHELLRLCFNASVVGGSQRMFKFALGKLEGSIISYCDMSKFRGTVYSELGFVASKSPRPSTHWYNPTTGQRITDNLLRQHGFDRLVGSKIGKTFGFGSSNEQLMKQHGFVCIRDKGQATYIFERQK